MLCRLLVTKEEAKEVSVEHVSLKKLYAVIEPSYTDPMLIRLDSDAGKIYCASFSAYPWTAHTTDLDPNIAPVVTLAEFIDQLIKEKDRKIYEFDTLFDFSSWMIDLKQGRIEIPTEDDFIPTNDNSEYKTIMLTGGSTTIHYSDINNWPLCGVIPAFNTWKSNDEVTCKKCKRIVENKSKAFKNIAKKTDE